MGRGEPTVNRQSPIEYGMSPHGVDTAGAKGFLAPPAAAGGAREGHTPRKRSRREADRPKSRWHPWRWCRYTQPPGHSWNTRNVPRRSALLAGFVMIGACAKASTKFGFATKQAARQPLKRARARPMSA